MRKLLTILSVIVLVVAIAIGVGQWLLTQNNQPSPGAEGPGSGDNGSGHAIEQPEWCPSVEVVAVPGTGESRADDNPDTPTANPNSLLLNVTGPLRQAYGADRVKIWTTPYPAQIKTHQVPQQLTYDDSQRAGRDVSWNEMAGLHSQCPASQFILMGFSQGASIAGDLAEQIGAGNGPVPADRVVGVALMGDPRRSPTQGINVGPPLAGQGIELSLQPFNALVNAAVPGATMRGPRAGFGPLNDRVQNVCLPGDSFCDVPPAIPDVIARAPEMFSMAGSHATYAINTDFLGGVTPAQWTEQWAHGLIDAAV